MKNPELHEKGEGGREAEKDEKMTIENRLKEINEKHLEDGHIELVEHLDMDLEKGVHHGGASDFEDGTVTTENEIDRNKIEHVISADHHVNDLSFRPVEPVDVAVRNLSVSIHSNGSIFTGLKLGNKRKEDAGDMVRILNNISADMPSGRMF